MFPLTHLYVNQMILGSMNAAQAIGSVLPDLLTYSGIGWEQAHDLKNDIMLPCDVYIADALHGIGLPGLDYYTDKSYRQGDGYAFYKAKYIKDAIIALGVPERDSLWRGHNIIEMAIEVNIRNASRMTYEPLETASDEKELIFLLESSLSESMGKQVNLSTPISLFVALDGNQRILAEHYSTKLNQAYGTEITRSNISNLIDLAQTHILKDYMKFLEDCATRMEGHLRVLERGISC